MIIGGKKLYGPHDRVPGLGHLRTLFVHIWWVPLVPLGTVLVLGDDPKGTCLQLPFSFKGALYAWARIGLVLAGLGCALLVVPMLADVFDSLSGSGDLTGFFRHSLYWEHLLILIGPAVTVPAYIGLGRFMGTASPARAEALRAQVR
jgi:hypothetical protein